MKTEEEDIIKAEEPILDYNQLDLDGTYSYMDYMRWHFKERVELIRGKIRKMSPGPNLIHQQSVTHIFGPFYIHFDKKPCSVYVAPFDVRLPIANLKNGKENTVVQPDLCIICDENLLDAQGCKGAPDLVVEILSPGNSNHDMRTKFDLYEESGVKEYWIVDPETYTVLVYTLKEDKYELAPSIDDTVIQSVLFPDLKIPLSAIFRNTK